MRWAQGWFQVSCRHLGATLRSPYLSLRQKLGATYLLGLREVYAWISMLTWPLLGFLAWRDGGIDLTSPIFMLLTLFISVSGPVQTLAAWRLAAPELRKHPGWFSVRSRRQPVLLHRVQEPDRPRGSPQAAARRAPVGRHTAHRIEHDDLSSTVRPSPTDGGGRMSTLTQPDPRTPRPDVTPSLPRRQSPAVPAHLAAWPRRVVRGALPRLPAQPHRARLCVAVVGRRPPGDARHRAVRGDVLRALRLRALAADRAYRSGRAGRPSRLGDAAFAGWPG